MIRVRWIAISFVIWQRCFPHIGMFSFLHRECRNLHEGRLRNKMHLHSTLKGCFFVLKDFDQSRELKHLPRKVYNFTCFPHSIYVLLRLRWNFVIRNLVGKQRIYISAALQRLHGYDSYLNKEFHANWVILNIKTGPEFFDA